MTLRQEAYNRIDQMTDEGIRVLIDIIDKMQTESLIGFKNTIKEDSVSYDAAITKDDKKQRFIQSLYCMLLFRLLIHIKPQPLPLSSLSHLFLY